MTNTNIAKLVSTFSDGQNLPILQTLRRERLICKLKKLRKTLYYRCDSITTVSKNSKFLLTLTFVLSLSKLYFLFDESVEFSPFILEISISPFNSYHLGHLVFLKPLFVKVPKFQFYHAQWAQFYFQSILELVGIMSLSVSKCEIWIFLIF